MTHTRDEVIHILGQQEPESDFWQQLIPADLPELARLAAGADLLLAARAVVIAARLDPVAAEPIALLASRSRIHQLRLAAISAAEYLSLAVTVQIVQRALDETEPSLLKFALRVASLRGLSQLKPKVQSLASDSDSEYVQRLARSVLSTI